MLSSYGIDDAADVTPAAIEAVPGFGQFLTSQVVNWRTSLERKFVFDQKRGADPADVRQIDQDIAKRRSEIEILLTRGPVELAEINRRIMNARVALRDQLQKAWTDWTQAQADVKAA
jgi:DNA-binding helix-hairpin-helix protein with protein kinase domain